MQNSKSPGRSWLYGGMFVCALGAVVTFAAYSSRPAEGAKTAPPATEKEVVLPEAAAEPGAKTKGVVWETSFEQAMQRARKEKKPIMVDFYTDWCGACKQFNKDVLPQKTFIEESKNWVMVHINGEKRPDVAGAYGVTGYPTFIFAQSTGKPVAILPGYAPDLDFAQVMRESRAKWEKMVS